MASSVFVTGIGGYVGRRVAAGLAGAALGRIVALVRQVPLGADRLAGVEYVVGDLGDPSGWGDALEGCDTVLHLAAITGKDRPRRYDEINARGTRELVRLAIAAGAERFILVSSVAVKFEDQTRYFYAHSKRAAEDAVRASDLAYAIVRPTMIFGPGAPVLEGLGKMAAAPVVPVFGSGAVRVQPVHVDDLARFLVRLTASGELAGDTIEVGGPETLTIEELLARIRRARSGRAPAAIHIPLAPVRFALGLLEPVLLPVLPLTAGQLATFANDGTAVASPALVALGDLKGLDEMLAPPAPAPAENALAAECAVLTRHLIGEAPRAYVVDRYVAFNRSEVARGSDQRFDRFLLAVARRGPFFARLVDGYSSRFRRLGSFRFKLVALLALLECAPPSAFSIDAPPRGGLVANFAKLGVRGVVDFASLALATVAFAPVHLVMRGDR